MKDHRLQMTNNNNNLSLSTPLTVDIWIDIAPLPLGSTAIDQECVNTVRRTAQQVRLRGSRISLDKDSISAATLLSISLYLTVYTVRVEGEAMISLPIYSDFNHAGSHHDTCLQRLAREFQN